MKNIILPITALAAIVSSVSAATFIGTDTYTGYSGQATAANDSPFSSVFGAISFQDPNGETGETDTTGRHDFRGLTASVATNSTYFFLEDVQDGQLDTPGATFSGGVVPRTAGGINGSNSSSASNTDNVAEDTIINSSFRTTGNLTGGYQGYIRVDFNSADLGGLLPTYAGIVFAERTTDSVGTPNGNGRLIEAYDSDDNLLESSFLAAASATNADGFLGLSTATGISYVLIAGDNEYDHFQYGTVVPEPSAFGLLAGALGFGWIMLRRHRA